MACLIFKWRMVQCDEMLAKHWSELPFENELPMLKMGTISAWAPAFPPDWWQIHGCAHEDGQAAHEPAAEHCRGT